MKIKIVWISVLIVCLLIIGIICTRYRWRELEDEYVTVKEYNIHFTMQQCQNGIRLGYFSPNNNPSDAPGAFEDAIVFGASDIPKEMLQDPFPWKNQRIDKKDLFWIDQQTMESAPIVYLDIEDEHIVRYLAIKSWLPGIKGSKVSWTDNMNKEGSWLRDKYMFGVSTLHTPIQLTPVQCSPLEDNYGLLLKTAYPYYLLTDSGFFGHFGRYIGTLELDKQVRGYWIVVNKTDISR